MSCDGPCHVSGGLLGGSRFGIPHAAAGRPSATTHPNVRVGDNREGQTSRRATALDPQCGPQWLSRSFALPPNNPQDQASPCTTSRCVLLRAVGRVSRGCICSWRVVTGPGYEIGRVGHLSLWKWLSCRASRLSGSCVQVSDRCLTPLGAFDYWGWTEAGVVCWASPCCGALLVDGM